MKRLRDPEDNIIFLSLPKEVFNKIQFKLQIVSLIYIGLTCKKLYQFQKIYLDILETEISIKCIRRVEKRFDEIGVLDLFRKFFTLFKCTIGGNLVSEYLFSSRGASSIFISIPKNILFESTVDFFKENYNLEKDAISYYRKSHIMIFLKIDDKCEIITFVLQDNENLIEKYETKLTTRGCIQICTDLEKVYCTNFWQLLDCFKYTLEEIQ